MTYAHVDVYPLRNTEWKTTKGRAGTRPNKGSDVSDQHAKIAGYVFFIRRSTEAARHVDEEHAVPLRHRMVKCEPRNRSYKPRRAAL